MATYHDQRGAKVTKSSRRLFIQAAAAAGIVAVTYNQGVLGAESGPRPHQKAHLKRSLSIESAIRRDDTIVRLGGDSQVYGMTWLSDDRQIVSIGDSGGWGSNVKDHYCSTRLFTVSGSPLDASFQVVASYPEMPIWVWLKGAAAPYYGLNVLTVDGRIYQYLASWDPPFNVNEKDRWPENNDWHWNAAKLIVSPDNGRTWCNQDGSTPVLQESQKNQWHKTMVFYKERQNVFSVVTFLQMGRDYQDNRDGYVYVDSKNGETDTLAKELVMFRVPKTQILDRSAYEYFAGLGTDGSGSWVRDLGARGVVHTFPHGGDGVSVVYNAPLGVYMMATSVMDSKGPDGICRADSKPSYLGLWIADRPWGPWRQIHEDNAWTPGGDPESRAAQTVIAPKWIAGDGKSFWLVWADAKFSGPESERADDVGIEHDHDEADFIDARARFRRNRPYYAMNTQRFDLVLA